jgi:tryptophan-rich sensory protein
MAVAAWMVWKKAGFQRAKKALALYGTQLIFNLGWSVLFFGFTWPLGALVEIVFLWGLILAALLSFYRISWVAGIMFVPYFLWVSFAVYLNAGIWLLN